MTVAYHDAVEQVVDAAREMFDDDVLLQLQKGVDFEVALAAFRKGQASKSVKRCVFRKKTWENPNGSFKLVPDKLWAAYCALLGTPDAPGPAVDDAGALVDPIDQVFPFDLEQWVLRYVVLPESFVALPDLHYRLRVLVNWMRTYFTINQEIDDNQMTNKDAFAPFYVFCVLGMPFPSNDDIYNNTFLVTKRVASLIEKSTKTEFDDEEEEEDTISFRDLAHQSSAWSMAESSLKFYEHNAGEIAELDEYKAFYAMQKNHARITRSQELIKHAMRDGRIHPMIARRAQTGRANCSLPNLLNIPFIDKQTGEQVFIGYLLPDDDDSILAGLDVSNAENHFAAFTFGDNAMAEACAMRDFHLEMTKVYWQEKYVELAARIAAGDKAAVKELKLLRKASKSVTFGDAYGAGVKKTARQIGATFEEAKAIKDARNRRFSAIAQGKKNAAALAERLYRMGVRPAYTVNWAGRRMFLDEVWRDREIIVNGKATKKHVRELKSYTVTNYKQQGGVGELIWDAIIAADEYFERTGSQTRVALQLHDEMVLSTPIKRAFDTTRAVSEIVWNQVPELDRMVATMPYTQFVATFDGGNATKWGYRADRPYPLDTNKYVNMYGTHELRPEDHGEAPTWIIDKHPDESSVDDLLRRQHERLLEYRDLLLASGDERTLHKVIVRLRQLRTRLGLSDDDAAPQPQEAYPALEHLFAAVDPALVKAKRVKVGATDYGKLPFAARMTLFQQAYLAGKLALPTFKTLVIDPIRLRRSISRSRTGRNSASGKISSTMELIMRYNRSHTER